MSLLILRPSLKTEINKENKASASKIKLFLFAYYLFLLLFELLELVFYGFVLLSLLLFSGN